MARPRKNRRVCQKDRGCGVLDVSEHGTEHTSSALSGIQQKSDVDFTSRRATSSNTAAALRSRTRPLTGRCIRTIRIYGAAYYRAGVFSRRRRPCSVESEAQITGVAQTVKKAARQCSGRGVQAAPRRIPFRACRRTDSNSYWRRRIRLACPSSPRS